jgi:Tol biopolymer transport system component
MMFLFFFWPLFLLSLLQPTQAADPPTEKSPQRQESLLLSNIRQVTFAGQRAGEGYFSHDGSWLIFQSERQVNNPFFQIYLMDVHSGETHRVSPGYGKTTCAWIHPNKKKVLFASTHLDPQARTKQQEEFDRRASGQTRRYSWDYDEYFDLFEADPQGRNFKNLTNTRGYDAEASWSPDGSLIVFSSNRHAYAAPLTAEEVALFEKDKSSQLDIYVMNADGTDVRRLTNASGADGGPFFSPDGKKIVWRHFAPDGATAEIFTMNVDGTEQRQLTHLGVMSWAPYFHPSGAYLIFATNLHGFGNFELYLVDAAGKAAPVRVTETDGFDGLPVFSPDGGTLAWTSDRAAGKRSQIFFAAWDDTEARQLLGLAPAQLMPSPSPPASPSVPLTSGQSSIRADYLHRHITTLASAEMDGRLTGTDGERRATDYVASVFASLGLAPAGDSGTFFQQFEFTAGVSLGPTNQLTLRTDDSSAPHPYVNEQDWRPLAFAKTGTFTPAEIVFAGYGIVAPAADGQGAYDSYTHLEVKDKWVLVFRYLPEKISPELRQHLNRYAGLRYKVMVARDRGARGLIVVSGPNAKVKDQLVPLSFDASLASTSIAALSVTDVVADQWVRLTGKTLQELQETLDSGQSLMGFAVPHRTLEAVIDIQQEKRLGRNVLARLPAKINARQPILVIGAHVDHLGHGSGAGSLAREEEKGQIHYGADDNASGVAGVLEIARSLSLQRERGVFPSRRDIFFAAWSGEELGLLGSAHFVNTFGDGRKDTSSLAQQIAAYLNMDMIGRLDKSLILQGIGSSSIWLSTVEQANAPSGLTLSLQNDSYLPTDATSFYLKGVPVLNAFTGSHAEYHSPRDTVEKINEAGLEKVVHFMAVVARSLATRTEPIDYIAMEKPASAAGRVALRAYLGTIPDYVPSNIAGVKLSGVAKGGPADQAGARSGDVIVELAGKKIENIYDYTYAVDALQIGTPVALVVLRGEQRLTLTVTPGRRE